MGQFRQSKKTYHGDKRNAKEALKALTGGGAKTVELDASKYDTFEITSDATGSTAITINISNAHEGQRIFIRVLSGGASDSIAAVNVDGVASDAIGSFNDSAENSLEVIVYDALTSHTLIHG